MNLFRYSDPNYLKNLSYIFLFDRNKKKTFIKKSVGHAKLYSEYFPIFNEEFPLLCACKHLTGLWASSVLSVVKTDWKFASRFLLVCIIGNEQITAAKDGAFVWVVGDGKLGQGEFEFFL